MSKLQSLNVTLLRKVKTCNYAVGAWGVLPREVAEGVIFVFR